MYSLVWAFLPVFDISALFSSSVSIKGPIQGHLASMFGHTRDKSYRDIEER